MPRRSSAFPPNRAPVLPLPLAGIELRAPDLAAKYQFGELLRDIAAAGERHHVGPFGIAYASYERYLDVLAMLQRQDDPEKEYYPLHTRYIYAHNKLAGEVRIRTKLSTNLREIGGSVLLYIRPSLRRQGIGRSAFLLSLALCSNLRMITILQAALADNIAAQKIMHGAGGISIAPIQTPAGELTRWRFFID